MIAFANEHGYVETLPDKIVDPKRGYPLQCGQQKWGGVSPTIPLNYHVQGTAMWWMMKAMIRCQLYLDGLNCLNLEHSYFMVMQVHDEIVFDFPFHKRMGNLPKIREIAAIMAKGGDDIEIPTPVSIEYHKHNWSEGVSV
jgi:DNA polymerase I-like protein with 3'-5' exonuclease and polymerase domains